MKKLLGYGFAIMIGVGAITFEMLESLNFWSIAFPPDKWYLAYLGFFLTSIAMLGYFYEFLFTAAGKTQKTTALVMMVVCGVGSLLTAGVGFQITAYATQGFQFTKDELEYMALIVQGLIAMHIIALFIYYGGDAIAQAWKDDDGDGVPNILDKDYKPNKGGKDYEKILAQQQDYIAKLKSQLEKANTPMNVNASETDAPSIPNSHAGKP